LLTFLYCVFAIGISVNKHFCSGKLTFVSFFHSVSEKDCCGDNHKKDCCNDKNHFIKVTDNHQVSTSKNISKITVFDLPQFITGINFSFRGAVVDIIASIFLSPPNIKGQLPIYLQDKAFLI
jgi:hypothetical protein